MSLKIGLNARRQGGNYIWREGRSKHLGGWRVINICVRLPVSRLADAEWLQIGLPICQPSAPPEIVALPKIDGNMSCWVKQNFRWTISTSQNIVMLGLLLIDGSRAISDIPFPNSFLDAVGSLGKYLLRGFNQHMIPNASPVYANMEEENRSSMVPMTGLVQVGGNIFVS